MLGKKSKFYGEGDRMTNYRSMGIRTEDDLSDHLFLRYEHRNREGIRELSELAANLYYRVERLEEIVRGSTLSKTGDKQ